MNSIWGHKKQIDFLNKSIENGKVAHAYLFSGPSFVGKRATAYWFAQRLLCEKSEACNECPQCRTFLSLANADFISLGSNETIKIEEIRELVYKLSLKPYLAKYKVAVIDNAENMTVEAQNALLKGLEEPKDHTVIILVSSNGSKLLRTISSRAQKINFGLVDPEEYKDTIENLEGSEAIMGFSSGRPGLMKLISSDPELVEKISEINDYYKVITSSDLADKLRLAYDVADLETSDIKQALEFLLIKFENELNQNPNKKTATNANSILQARKYIDQNVNSKLMLTNLMLALK